MYDGHFDQPKTKRSARTIPIGGETAEILAAIRPAVVDPRALVFATREGLPLGRWNLLRKHLKPAAKKLGLLAVTWHLLRHSHATMLDSVGTPIGTMQSLLGHSTPEITREIYLHAIPEEQRRAVESVERLVFGPKLDPPGLCVWGGALLEAATRERTSEMVSRVVDGLSWFGEATFEVSVGKQIAKFEAALERLTVTGRGRFALHSFCARTALLAYDPVQRDLEDCYWKAFEIHIARSQVVHGIVSSGSPLFRKSLQTAHEVTRTVLFRGLEIQWHLDRGRKPSTRKSLDDFYNKQMSPHARLFSELRKELNVQHDLVRKSRS